MQWVYRVSLWVSQQSKEPEVLIEVCAESSCKPELLIKVAMGVGGVAWVDRAQVECLGPQGYGIEQRSPFWLQGPERRDGEETSERVSERDERRCPWEKDE